MTRFLVLVVFWVVFSVAVVFVGLPVFVITLIFLVGRDGFSLASEFYEAVLKFVFRTKG